MKTVGLFEKDARIYFVSNNFAIVGNPLSGNTPTLVKRLKGDPTPTDWKIIDCALALTEMILVGQPFMREDGLWCHEVKEREVGE